ncbi:MAG: acyl carrier protein [Planctomycetes bacterium]|nr:acyl carrier protein [Planctomycetota bacterium]
MSPPLGGRLAAAKPCFSPFLRNDPNHAIGPGIGRFRPSGASRPRASLGSGELTVPNVDNVEERVINIVCEQLGTSRDKVTPQTSFINDLGADSLDQVELIMEFEDEFEVNIPDEDAEKIQTVSDAIKYIQGKLS